MTYISMLRGINVSGQKNIKMDALVAIYESLGFQQIKTYIQSGNLIFKSPPAPQVKIAAGIERKIKEILGLEVVVIIRTRAELGRVIENNPFTDKDHTKLHVTFLSEPVGDPLLEKVSAVKDNQEAVYFSGTEIYLYCPNGYGKSKLSNRFFEKLLMVSATTRNWNTVNRLFTLTGSDEKKM